jgi:hypothetical protein
METKTQSNIKNLQWKCIVRFLEPTFAFDPDGKSIASMYIKAWTKYWTLYLQQCRCPCLAVGPLQANVVAVWCACDHYWCIVAKFVQRLSRCKMSRNEFYKQFPVYSTL